jgi:hypothetical protein
MCAILGWALKEMGASAKRGAKKAFAPLLWPIVLIVVVASIYVLAGPQTVGALLQLGLTLLLIAGGLYYAIFGRLPKKKAKKKHE